MLLPEIAFEAITVWSLNSVLMSLITSSMSLIPSWLLSRLNVIVLPLITTSSPLRTSWNWVPTISAFGYSATKFVPFTPCSSNVLAVTFDTV